MDRRLHSSTPQRWRTFRVSGFGFRVWGLGFGVGVWGFGLRVWGWHAFLGLEAQSGQREWTPKSGVCVLRVPSLTHLHTHT
jgi:hypothetical protein